MQRPRLIAVVVKSLSVSLCLSLFLSRLALYKTRDGNKRDPFTSYENPDENNNSDSNCFKALLLVAHESLAKSTFLSGHWSAAYKDEAISSIATVPSCMYM